MGKLPILGSLDCLLDRLLGKLFINEETLQSLKIYHTLSVNNNNHRPSDGTYSTYICPSNATPFLNNPDFFNLL